MEVMASAPRSSRPGPTTSSDARTAGIADEQVTGLERREHLRGHRLQVLVPPVAADVIVVAAELVDGLTRPFFIRDPDEIARSGECVKRWENGPASDRRDAQDVSGSSRILAP